MNTQDQHLYPTGKPINIGSIELIYKTPGIPAMERGLLDGWNMVVNPTQMQCRPQGTNITEQPDEMFFTANAIAERRFVVVDLDGEAFRSGAVEAYGLTMLAPVIRNFMDNIATDRVTCIIAHEQFPITPQGVQLPRARVEVDLEKQGDVYQYTFYIILE